MRTNQVKTLYKNYVHFRRIKRDKKLFRGAGTQKPLFARVAYNIFSTIEQKNEKKTTINNSSVLCVVREKCNKHSLFARS
jgi:hypothetical protein